VTQWSPKALISLGELLKGSVEGRNGDPGEARTLNIQLRRLALYPVELRGHDPILSKMMAAARNFDDLASKQNAAGSSPAGRAISLN
jgi:hypothetical protein